MSYCRVKEGVSNVYLCAVDDSQWLMQIDYFGGAERMEISFTNPEDVLQTLLSARSSGLLVPQEAIDRIQSEISEDEPTFTKSDLEAERREAFVSGWRSGAKYARAGRTGDEAQAFWIEYRKSLEGREG